MDLVDMPLVVVVVVLDADPPLVAAAAAAGAESEVHDIPNPPPAAEVLDSGTPPAVVNISVIAHKTRMYSWGWSNLSFERWGRHCGIY
jgi:hypothetical protein